MNLEGALKMDGYDDCIVGVIERFGQPTIVCYDKDLIIAKMVNEDGMDEAEAHEFFEYNQLGAWLGEGTPCFLTRMDAKQIDELAE